MLPAIYQIKITRQEDSCHIILLPDLSIKDSQIMHIYYSNVNNLTRIFLSHNLYKIIHYYQHVCNVSFLWSARECYSVSQTTLILSNLSKCNTLDILLISWIYLNIYSLETCCQHDINIIFLTTGSVNQTTSLQWILVIILHFPYVVSPRY